MQHETHTHGINMSALGRDKQSLSLAGNRGHRSAGPEPVLR
jgi:hypothetical protein